MPFSGPDLAEAVPDPLLVFDGGGMVVHANAAARAAFGQLLPGTPLQLKFRAPEMQDLVRRALEPGAGTVGIDFSERVPIERWFRVSAGPLGSGGNLFAMVFKDQSETRRIDRMRADFIANASHELRTPLASIAGFIETLRGPARDDARAREQFLEIMEKQTGRMARLIDDLLSLSRLEMKTHLRPGQTVDVARVLRGVVDSMGHLASESGVAIKTSIGDGLPPVPGDPDELFQVFENLLENACKYGQTGGRVEISATISHEAEREIAITFRDFGPGIPEEHIPRITERFYRVDVGNSRAQKGTGLGLAIVKHILTRHEGRLSIASTPGDGATFTVHLPAPVDRVR